MGCCRKGTELAVSRPALMRPRNSTPPPLTPTPEMGVSGEPRRHDEAPPVAPLVQHHLAALEAAAEPLRRGHPQHLLGLGR